MAICLCTANTTAPNAEDKIEASVKSITGSGINVPIKNDTKISFKPIGTLLMDGALYCSPQKNLFPDGINIPDVRLGVMANMDKWSAKIEIGYAFGKVLLKDIWLQYNFSKVDYLRAGLQMHHLGYQNSQAACMKVTMIEPISNTVFNEPHMIGVSWYHNADKYYTTLSAYVEPKSSSVILAKDEMIREGYGLRTRIVGRPYHSEGKMLQFGLSGAFETPRYTPSTDGDTHDSFSFGANFPTKVAIQSALGATISHSMNLWKLSPELMGCYGRVALETQWYYLRVNRRMSLSPFRALGGYTTLRGAILGKNYNYNMGVAGIDTPEKGTLEGVVSYNYTKLSDNKCDIYGGRLNDLSAGFNYYINQWIIAKFRYSYTHTWDRADVSPVTLNTFQARLQFIF